MKLTLENISSNYMVRTLTESDIPMIYELCKGNLTYYHYLKAEPSIDYLKKVFITFPPTKTLDDKYFVGFYKDDQLVAISDFITGYPDLETIYIGWFMVRQDLQGVGIGSELIEDLLCFFKEQSFRYVSLGCIKENTEALVFWLKNKFCLTGSELVTENLTILPLVKKL